MNFENILLEKKNSIAYVTINRPKVLNALNMATMEELRGAFHEIKSDSSIRVVIFTSIREFYPDAAAWGTSTDSHAQNARLESLPCRNITPTC